LCVPSWNHGTACVYFRPRGPEHRHGLLCARRKAWCVRHKVGPGPLRGCGLVSRERELEVAEWRPDRPIERGACMPNPRLVLMAYATALASLYTLRRAITRQSGDLQRRGAPRPTVSWRHILACSSLGYRNRYGLHVHVDLWIWMNSRRDDYDTECHRHRRQCEGDHRSGCGAGRGAQVSRRMPIVSCLWCNSLCVCVLFCCALTVVLCAA